jgi:hypothetical protein
MKEKNMNANELQESLTKLYYDLNEVIYPNVKAKNLTLAKDQKATWPLFIHVPEEYAKADIRLMVFGQETNNWWGTFGEDVSDDYIDYAIEELVHGWEEDAHSGYKGFFSEKYCYAYGGQFWNLVKKFIEDMQVANKGAKLSYIWNNVIKMGLGRNNPGTTPYWYETIIKPHFNALIIKEIEILQPDFLVFFCGPDYDWRIGDIFGNPPKKPVEGFSGRELCEFVIPNVKKAFRTYHPGFLYRNNSFRPYTDFIGTMVKELSR